MNLNIDVQIGGMVSWPKKVVLAHISRMTRVLLYAPVEQYRCNIAASLTNKVDHLKYCKFSKRM